jgi:hypothetical protein
VAGAGRSAVTLALTRAAGAGGDLPLAFLPPARRKKEAPLARGRGALAFWLAAAAVLLLAAAALRYLPPILRLPRLAERVEEARTRRAAMPELDRELGFLDRLEKSQPPYLEALLAMARAIPKGTAFESLSLNRQGDVSIQGRAANFDGLNELRGKLAASGWFTKVIIIEHTPKEREQVDFRISATLRVGSPLPALPAAGGAPAGPGTPAGPPAPEAMAAPVPAGPVPPAGEPPPKQDASPPPGTAPGAASAPPEPPKGAAPAADAAEREHLKKQVAESARALGGARGGEVKVEFADGVDAESRAALEKTAADATAAEEQNK